MAKQYFPHDAWQLRESRPDVTENEFKESVFSLGNGYLAVRGEVEEGITAGDGFAGTYLYGVYETEPVTHYWKRTGFVEESSRLVPTPRWLGISVSVNGEVMDLGKGSCKEYSRVLDMRKGLLGREFVWTSPGGVKLQVRTERLVSIVRDHVAAMTLGVCPLEGAAKVEIRTGVDGTVRSTMTGACPWTGQVGESIGPGAMALLARTVRSGFEVATAFSAALRCGGKAVEPAGQQFQEGQCRVDFSVSAAAGQWVELIKLVVVASSRETAKGQVLAAARAELDKTRRAGYEAIRKEHVDAWEAHWQGNPLKIEGDAASQQGLNYCMFSLRQIYSGRYGDLNFVCKAFGENYGGHYFWDSEISVLPYFVYADPAVARSLLMYRYNTLEGARAKARTLRLKGAMFPMYTINGREDSRHWEIQLLEIHPTAVLAWAIGLYVDVTGDEEFLADHGTEMLIEIARFWTSRSFLSARKGNRYVINGVVGPDEYTMVVNNNCFTNTMAAHALRLAAGAVDKVRAANAKAFAAVAGRLKLEDGEAAKWRDVAERMYIPYEQSMGIHAQDDTFLDLEPVDISKVPDSEIPLQKHWPWDKVLRSRIVKQPDVVLLMNTLNDRYSPEQKRANYAFYESVCMHDSSLSGTEHSILASELGMAAEAYKYYLRIARIDIDNYNFNTNEGLHTTSMCGALSVVVRGFGGLRLREGKLSLDPHCPEPWTGFSFRIHFRGRKLSVSCTKAGSSVELLEGEPLDILAAGRPTKLAKGKPVPLA